ncbi:hypothetical protein Dimus_036590, partial [Dionaea muscipula]
FGFPQESTLLQVMQQSTYVLSGQILIIRRMPPFFDFAKEGRSLMPIWVILPNIPLKMMRREFLQVLGSQIGTPIMTDKLTHTMERVSFARMLIEIDLAKPIITEIPIKLPGNIIHIQQIKYEKRPHFCSSCWSIGHISSNCSIANKKTTVTAPSQHIWKPKIHKKQYAWQRVPVKNQNADKLDDAQQHKLHVPIPQSSTGLELDHQSDAPIQPPATTKSNFMIGSSPAQTSSTTVEETQQQDQNEIHHEDDQQPVHDKDGFQKIQRRRKRNKGGIRTNPEHHQDKPTAKATS